ncbi:T9SS type A sorting domain-containing protein [Hymenobacter humi]|uniref:T9SS type A sorting domain-containing protein n=1 Tax=Hymenobacter humi TaxID=1411620 RepID=A0ABW2U1R6_9BACT
MAVAATKARVYVSGNVGAPAARFGELTLPGSGGFLAALADPVLTSSTAASPLPGVMLYPNPAHSSTTVVVPPVPGTSQATLVLRDAMGRLVRFRAITLPAAEALRHELSLAGLAPGLYVLQVQAGARRAIRQLAVF